MSETIIYSAVFLLAYGGVRIFRGWSRRRRLFDVPNERSSHTEPTPRGGGLIIVLICLAAYALLPFLTKSDFRWSYAVGAVSVALVSWLDDLYTVSFVWRFLIHSGAALLVILTLGSFDRVYLPWTGDTALPLFGAGLTFLWIVWLTNAYNFMDGIDGIAGIQAVAAGIGWLAFGKLLNDDGAGVYGGIIASASLGFLLQNWQPAKIFMGDVGSAFLGYSFAVLPLLAKSEARTDDKNQTLLLPIGIALVWLFVFDTLWTFGRRIVNGEKVWQAHRSHFYQKLVINGFSHQTVTLLYGSLSLLNGGVLFVLLLTAPAERGFGSAIVVALLGLQAIGICLAVSFSGKFIKAQQSGASRVKK